jgi:hypothetical protein
MSLRDYFAAKAMAGFAANTDLENVLNSVGCEGIASKDMARYSYLWADAMLAERLQRVPATMRSRR